MSRPTLFARADAALLCAALAIGPLLAWLALATEPDPRGFGTHEQLGLAPCGLRAWTGWPCPACGVTTAVVLATRGRLLHSLRTQPFGLLLALLLALLFVAALASIRSGRDLRPLVYARPAWQRALFVGAIALAWIYKLLQAPS